MNGEHGSNPVGCESPRVAFCRSKNRPSIVYKPGVFKVIATGNKGKERKTQRVAIQPFIDLNKKLG
jgi:hypothetical protein